MYSNSRSLCLAAELLASLAHTRAGIPDAIVTMGAVAHLSAHLNSPEEEVTHAAHNGKSSDVKHSTGSGELSCISVILVNSIVG